MVFETPDAQFETALAQYIESETEQTIQELIDLVRIPSISHLPEKHGKDCQNVLETMGEIVSAYGFSPEIVQTPGLPAFVATLESDPTQPWIFIYNHMDVQPAEEPQWESSPFEPVIKDGKIYGRGSTDDKGPALTTLHAIDFLRKQGYALPNIQLIYETEEESGSKHFGQFLDAQKSKFKSPVSILVSDTIFEGEHPAITYRLKGLLEAVAELKTGSRDLHSGVFGGVVKNPLNLLLHALSSCISPQGQVTIPGIMEGVPVISPAEKAAIAEVAQIFDFEKMKGDSGLASFYTEDPEEILTRIWTQPTFEVHGFEGIQTTPDVIKTALPYHVKAKITMRLVAGQDPSQVMDALEKQLQRVVPEIVLQRKGLLKGCKTEIENPFMACAQAACQFGFGKPPVFVGSGGTIGALPEFQRVFPQAPIVLLAQSLMSDGYHAPNENFRISQIQAGIKTMAAYLNGVARLK